MPLVLRAGELGRDLVAPAAAIANTRAWGLRTWSCMIRLFILVFLSGGGGRLVPQGSICSAGTTTIDIDPGPSRDGSHVCLGSCLDEVQTRFVSGEEDRVQVAHAGALAAQLPRSGGEPVGGSAQRLTCEPG